MRRLPIYLLALALAAAPALTQTPVRLPDLDAATTPLGDDDLFLVRQDGETRDEKVTWANVRASLQDALVLVLGPASVCVDNQLARWDGASNTQLQCSALTVADTTGDITAPGALTISTAGSNGDITLDPHGTGIVISSATIKCGKTSNCNLYLDGFGGGYGVFSGTNWFTNYLGAATSSSGSIGWTSGAISNPRDLVIARDAANTLAQRNSTNAQTYRLYGTYTDASNYERLSLSTTAGTGATIAAETAGTGADNLTLRLAGAGTSGVLWNTHVEPNTAGSGAPNVLTAAESGTLLTNEGATAQNYHTLPTAAVGLCFEFVVADADGIRIVAGADDTIRVAGDVSATAGYIQNSTIGGAVRLCAINAVEWVAMSYVGTWTVDS